MPQPDTPAALAALDELERLAKEARDTMAYAACRWLDGLPNGTVDHEANSIASKAQGAFIAACSPDVILALLAAARQGEETEQLRGIVWTLADALAKRCLADANLRREHLNDWPAGQEWDELAGSSQSTFRARAYVEAGLDRQAVVSLLCDEYGNAKPFDAARAASQPQEVSRG